MATPIAVAAHDPGPCGGAGFVTIIVDHHLAGEILLQVHGHQSEPAGRSFRLRLSVPLASP
jgi:hypothetical protein